jgi:hypothetical protein
MKTLLELLAVGCKEGLVTDAQVPVLVTAFAVEQAAEDPETHPKCLAFGTLLRASQAAGVSDGDAARLASFLRDLEPPAQTAPSG